MSQRGEAWVMAPPGRGPREQCVDRCPVLVLFPGRSGESTGDSGGDEEADTVDEGRLEQQEPSLRPMSPRKKRPQHRKIYTAGAWREIHCCTKHELCMKCGRGCWWLDL